ncbi:hypothetical protein ACMC56_16505 [Campylobacterota bacterium DY0563]
MKTVVRKQTIKNEEKLFYKQEKKNMKTIIVKKIIVPAKEEIKSINSWSNNCSWQGKRCNEGLIRMLLETTAHKKKTMQILYEDLDYFEEELNLYAESI